MSAHAARMSHPERRSLYAGLAAAAVTIVVLAGILVSARHPGSSSPSDPFVDRIGRVTSCRALASEWDDHHGAYEVTGSREALRRAQVVHDREMAIGC